MSNKKCEVALKWAMEVSGTGAHCQVSLCFKEAVTMWECRSWMARSYKRQTNVEPNNSVGSFLQNSLTLPDSGLSCFSTKFKDLDIWMKNGLRPCSLKHSHDIKIKTIPRQIFQHWCKLTSWKLGLLVMELDLYHRYNIDLIFIFHAICSYMCLGVNYYFATILKLI